jgi:hypothetical protein
VLEKDMPEELKTALRRGSANYNGVNGIFEQDDMDNWQECTTTCRGVVSRRLDLNVQMGLGHDRFNESLDATVSDHRVSESNHRSFYRRWDELMSGNGR